MGKDAKELDGLALGDIIAAEAGPLYVKLERVTMFDFAAGAARGCPAIQVGAYDETPGGRRKPPRMFTPEIMGADGAGFPALLRMLADELERVGVTGREGGE